MNVVSLHDIVCDSPPGLLYTADMFKGLDTDKCPEELAGHMNAVELETLLRYQKPTNPDYKDAETKWKEAMESNIEDLNVEYSCDNT